MGRMRVLYMDSPSIKLKYFFYNDVGSITDFINILNFIIIMATLISRIDYIRSLPMDVRRRKSYVMMDIITATANNEEGHWVFCTDDGKVALQSIQCLECGGYTMTATPNVYLNISHNALCCCDGFMETYLDNVFQILEWEREELQQKRTELEGDTDDEETETEDNYDIDDYYDY